MKAKLKAVAILVLGSVALAACASGGDQSLVSPSAPHGILSTALPVGPNYYPVRIVWLDGNYLSTQGKQSSFWVSPGVHEIGFRAIINTNRGPAAMSNPAAGRRDMPTLKVDVKQGYSYYFGAQIPPSRMTNDWQPVVIKTEPSGG